MSALVEILDQAAAAWWTCMLHATWQSSLLAAAFLAVARLGRRWPAQIRYALVLIALVKFAIPPMLSTPVGLFSHLGPSVVLDAGADASPADVSALAGAEAGASADAGRWAIARVSGRAWAMLAHGLGALAVAAWLLAQWMKIARLVRRCEAIESGPLYDEVARLRQVLGLRRPVRVLLARQVVPPMAFGLWRPSVLVPEYLLDGVSARQVRTVLAHELAHHRRGDMWVNWLQGLLAAVWWFNPVFWLLSQTVRRTREDCCDDMLLAGGLTTDETYCEALLRVAGQMGRSLLLATASAFARQTHSLGDRIRRIMDRRLPRARKLSLATAGAMVLLAVVVLPGLRTDTAPSGASRPALASAGAGGQTATDETSMPASGGAGLGVDLTIGGERVVGGGGRLVASPYGALADARRTSALLDPADPEAPLLHESGALLYDSPAIARAESASPGGAVAAARPGRLHLPNRSDGRLLEASVNMTPGITALGPAAFIESAFAGHDGADGVEFRQYVDSLPVFRPPADGGEGDGQLADGSGADEPTQSPKPMTGRYLPPEPAQLQLYDPQVELADLAPSVNDIHRYAVPQFDESLHLRGRLYGSEDGGSFQVVLIDALEAGFFDDLLEQIGGDYDDALALLDYLGGADPWAGQADDGGAMLPEPAVTLPLCLGGLLLLRRRRRR